MEKEGINITIISNNKLDRVKVFSDPLDVPYVYSARKPLTRAFKSVAKEMALPIDKVVVIGDQIFNDELGGKRAGCDTILVVPEVQSDAKITKNNEKIERLDINNMSKKVIITWKE